MYGLVTDFPLLWETIFGEKKSQHKFISNFISKKPKSVSMVTVNLQTSMSVNLQTKEVQQTLGVYIR
jgi:hypothetical protein